MEHPSRVVWDWRNPPAKEAGADPGRLRGQGTVRGLVGLALATLIFFAWSRTLGIIGWSLAGAVLALALVSPGRAYAALERAIGRAAWVVGRVLTWILLTPVYYVFFTPFRVFLRRGRRDRLARRFPGGLPSYWVPRKVERLPAERYRKLY